MSYYIKQYMNFKKSALRRKGLIQWMSPFKLIEVTVVLLSNQLLKVWVFFFFASKALELNLGLCYIIKAVPE